jgi:hypothetical protein
MGYVYNPLLGLGLDNTGTGGSTPGGSTTQLQFNDGGAFAGDADLTWNSTTNVLGVTGDVNLSDGGTYTTTLQTITPTAARTISLPDATGTVALVAGSSGQLVYNNAGVNAGASTLTYDGSILTTSGRFINSYNATASSPAKAFTGTWFTGGTATTTKPQVLIEPTGATSTAWSTSGTGLGVNAATGFTGRLLDLQTNGTSRAIVTGGGQLLAGTSTARGVGTSVLWQSYIEGNSGSGIYPGLAIVDNSTGSEGPYFVLGKSKSATVGSSTVVAINDSLGGIVFAGADGTNLQAQGARIGCFVDGTPGTGDMPGRLVFSTTADGAASPSQAVIIKSNQETLFTKSTIASGSTGWYGVSMDAASGSINVSRNGNNAIAFFHSSNANGLGGSPVGTVSITTTATAYNTSSDYRLKENVTAVTDGITRLQELKPSRFNFIADPAKTVDGFIAHEVQAVVPEAITGTKDAIDNDGNPIYQGIDQSKLVPLLTAALQEAIGEIESLKARVAALEGA